MLCVLSLLYEEHLSYRCPYKVCLKSSHLFNFFIFLYISLYSYLGYLFGKGDLVLIVSGHQFFPTAAIFYSGFTDIILLCTKFSTLFKKPSCCNSYLIPPKVIPTVQLDWKETFSFHLFKADFWARHSAQCSYLAQVSKFSSGGLSGAVQSVRQNPKSETTPLAACHHTWTGCPWGLCSCVCSKVIYCF